MRKSIPRVDGYLCGVRRREFRVASAARGSPFSGFFLAVSDDFVFLGYLGRGFGQRASGPGRTKYSSMGPCAIAARELCPIYFNLDVSALVYRGDCNLRLPLRLNLHCKTGLSWRVPSKLLAMARARAQRRRADHSACFGSHGVCAKNACTLVYGHPRACVDCPERYFEPSRKKSCETRTTW